MVQTVARQQELRLRILVGVYQGFIGDPQAFWNISKLDVVTPPPQLERPESSDEDDTPSVKVDFQAQPATAPEVRAAAYYLLERGLLMALSDEALKAQNLEAGSLMLHITANGVDALETYVMTNHARALERPVGFHELNGDSERLLGMPRAQAQTTGAAKKP